MTGRLLCTRKCDNNVESTRVLVVKCLRGTVTVPHFEGERTVNGAIRA